MDDSITKSEYHSHTPYSNSTYFNNDEIRIPIQNQELYTLPSQSHLYIEGKLLTSENKHSPTLRFISNGIAFLFDENPYELGEYIIDRNLNVGITTIIKTLISYSPNEMTRWKNADCDVIGTPRITDGEGHFSVCFPLRLLLLFCEYFKKNIVNTRQEFILIRSKFDINAVRNSNDQEVAKVVLNKTIWKVPHVSLSDAEKLKFLQYNERGNDLPIAFRS